MSVSDFEERVFRYVWRGFVLAGLLSLLWSAFAPAPQTQWPSPGLSDTASNHTSHSTASINEAR